MISAVSSRLSWGYSLASQATAQRDSAVRCARKISEAAAKTHGQLPTLSRQKTISTPQSHHRQTARSRTQCHRRSTPPRTLADTRGRPAQRAPTKSFPFNGPSSVPSKCSTWNTSLAQIVPRGTLSQTHPNHLNFNFPKTVVSNPSRPPASHCLQLPLTAFNCF